MTSNENDLIATMETGGAHALATAALDYLGAYDQGSDELQEASALLHQASKLADHAALCRRRARPDDAPTDEEQHPCPCASKTIDRMRDLITDYARKEPDTNSRVFEVLDAISYQIKQWKPVP